MNLKFTDRKDKPDFIINELVKFLCFNRLSSCADKDSKLEIFENYPQRWGEENEVFLQRLVPYSPGRIIFRDEDKNLFGYEIKDGKAVKANYKLIEV